MTTRRGDRGAAAVEFALLFPIFMILALGIIAVGTAFSKQINVTQAAREASRFGATYVVEKATFPSEPTGITAWLKQVDKALTEAAGAANDPIGGFDYRCVAFVVTDAAGTIDVGASKSLENGATFDSGACKLGTPSASLSATSYVQTAIARESGFFVLFINPTIELDSVSVTPYEPRPIIPTPAATP